MVLLTRKQLPVVLKLDLFFFFFEERGGGGRPSPNDSDYAYFAGIV